MNGFIENIETLTLENTNFRKVLHTGKHMQLVFMSLKPKEDIGEEVHNNVDQFFRVEKGSGKIVMNNIETVIQDGSAIVVPAGTKHNLINTSEEDDLKLYTIYSPANHPEGTIHATKAQAEEYEKSTHE